jgi:hypothetical protein
MKKLKKFEMLVVLEKRKVSIVIYHDLPDKWGMSIDAAYVNWIARTNKYSENSFRNYLREKTPEFTFLSSGEYERQKYLDSLTKDQKG